MHERFISNPHSRRNPLQRYGTLVTDAAGEHFYETDDGVQLPYIGPVLDYKEDDPEHLRPQLRNNACVAQWNLAEEEDMKQYRALCEKICRQQAIVSYEEKVYDDDIKSWRILIRWMEPYYGPPSTALRNVREQAKASGGRLPKPVPPKKLREDDPPIQQPADLAKVAADDLNENKDSNQVESNDDIPSRYGTFDEAISAFGDLLPELGAPFADDEEDGGS